MKLQGWVKRKQVVLIDSDINHNFILTKLVAELGLVVEETLPYKVYLEDGYKKTSSRCYRYILVLLQDLEVKEKFYLFELGGVHLILRVIWLPSLGEIKINWRNLTMSFGHGEKEVLIRGDPIDQESCDL